MTGHTPRADGDPTIVLLPGLDGTGVLFRRLVSRLGSHTATRIVSYPLDRHLRYGELADLVLDALPEGPHVIVAESFSGPVAVRVAHRSPRGLRGIVMVCSFVSPPVPRSLVRPVEWAVRCGAPRFATRALLLDSRCDRGLLSEVIATVRSVPRAVLSARLHEALVTDSRDALRGVAVPLAYLAASRDRILGSRGLRSVLEVRSDVAVDRIDGPHLLAQARPVEVAEAVTSWTERWA